MNKQTKKIKENKPTTQEDINKMLWDAANSARATVDASIYKDYALTMLFFKYASDLAKKQLQHYIEIYGEDKERIEEKMRKERFFIPADANFDTIYEKLESDNIGEEIDLALSKIEKYNAKKLDGVFTVKFNNETILGGSVQRNKMIRSMVRNFNKKDLAEIGEDVIGSAYMYMIEKFGEDVGRKAGEFFTAHMIAKLVAKLARPRPGDRICDFTVGAGGLLLLAAKEVKAQGSPDYALYGQESVGSTYQIARMNMFLNKEDNAQIEWGDTINNPLLIEHSKLMQFDICVANPPFSLKQWGAESAEADQYNRFHRGIPPKEKGDYAFITHMVETLKPKKGRGAIILPHGALFRGNVEGRIREHLIQENLIDAVIGLPANLFQTTAIPVAIVVFDKSREKGGLNEKCKDIFFIDASDEYVKNKSKNLLQEQNLDKILNTYQKRKDIKKFSCKVSRKTIEENNYNLNISRYVDSYEEEEQVNILEVQHNIVNLRKELDSLYKEMDGYIKEINLDK